MKVCYSPWTSIGKWLLHDATKYAWVNDRAVDFDGAEYGAFIGMVIHLTLK